MEVSAHVHVPVALPPRTEPRNPLIRGTQEGPRASMDSFEKREIFRPCREERKENHKSSAIQPVPYAFTIEIHRVRVSKKIHSDKSVLIHKPKSVHCRQVAVDAMLVVTNRITKLEQYTGATGTHSAVGIAVQTLTKKSHTA